LGLTSAASVGGFGVFRVASRIDTDCPREIGIERTFVALGRAS